mmetsp:Transcript_21491/g.3498  ORF Transcript_21491/g.3498 Transcript_21491/m.3498 type:complete len:101 (+) Transcript_21491:576-878(+)
MRYRKKYNHVLNNLSFTCPGGKRIAIIGRTGAGKSSIMLSLMRMYPLSEGKILIDGTDISQITIQSLRQNVSIIPQSPTIFKVNLRNNLDPLHVYSDEDL